MSITNRRQAQDTLRKYAEAKKEAEEAAAKVKDIQSDLIGYFDKVKDDSVSVELEDGTTLKGTCVRSTTIDINVPRLKKALGTKLWGKVTIRTLDKGLLEQRIADGDVKAMDVAECSTEVERSPYVRVTSSKKKAAGSLKEAVRQKGNK